MKKIMKPFVLVAAAAMALASCQKNEIPAPEKQDVHFTINAGIETKTSIVESTETDENGKPIYHAQWDGNEELGVLFDAPNAETTASNVVTLTNAVSGRTASFQGNVTLDKPSGTFYAFYPAAAFNRGYGEGDARLDLKNVQEPTATSFDPSCDILVAKPYNYEVVDGKVVADGLEFARLMSVLRIDLKSEFADIQNEFVESVSFTAGDVQITGYARIFLDNPKFDKWASNGTQWCTVTANYDSDLVSINGTSNSVYLVIAPVTIPANKDLTFEIKTKNYNISKTIKSPEMKFTAGKVSKINLTIAADNCDKIDTSIDYSGEYLIVGDNDGAKYAAVKYDGTSNNLKGIALTMEDDKILGFDTMDDSKMVVTKVADGTYVGLYTIQDASGKYLYAASSSANNLKSSAISNTTPEHYYWSITESDGVYEIIASKSGNRNVMQFNYNGGSPIFNCYSSASQKAVALYAYSDIKPDTRPKIFVTNTTYSVKATDTSVEIPYTVKNITGTISATVADDATISDINPDVTDGKVTISFAANDESAEKTATIVLSYEGAQSVNVVITQEGKPAEGAPVEVTDILTLTSLNVTYNSYTTWSGKKFTSDAVYAGNSFNTNSSIQLRSTNPSGIVTTTSGGKVRKVIVQWHSATGSTRYITIYGKNSAYSSSADLYDSSKRGESLGTIANGTTELEISGDYAYFGILASGALYLPEIKIVWETSGSGGETPDPTPDPDEPGTIYQFTSGDITPGGSKNTGTINGLLGYKLGSGTAAGTLSFPAGYSEIAFYAVGWSSGTNTITLTNGTVNGSNSLTLTNNSVAANNFTDGFSKTLTNQDAYKYTIVVANPSQSVVLSLKRGLVWGFEGVPAN